MVMEDKMVALMVVCILTSLVVCMLIAVCVIHRKTMKTMDEAHKSMIDSIAYMSSLMNTTDESNYKKIKEENDTEDLAEKEVETNAISIDKK